MDLSNPYVVELANALVWWYDKRERGDAPIVKYHEFTDVSIRMVKVTVDFGILGLRQYTHSLKDAETTLVNAYLVEAWSVGKSVGPVREVKVVGQEAFPVRMAMPEPVEYLDSLEYIAEVQELHDPDMGLERYIGAEPRTLEQHLHVEPGCETETKVFAVEQPAGRAEGEG